jgi:hypothetical protein
MTQIVYTPGSGKVNKTIAKYLNLPDLKHLTDKEIDLIVKIKGTLSLHGIDDETAVGILESYEGKYGKSEELGQRLERFSTFLGMAGNRENLIDSVKNLGLLSHSELETQAQETGDWVSVIKKNQPYRSLADIDNPKDAVGSKTDLQQVPV